MSRVTGLREHPGKWRRLGERAAHLDAKIDGSLDPPGPVDGVAVRVEGMPFLTGSSSPIA